MGKKTLSFKGNLGDLLKEQNSRNFNLKIIDMNTETIKTKNGDLPIHDVTNFLIELGYTGFPLSKQHYSGDENCLTAYEKHFMNGHVILARQFSNFFGFRVQS